MKSDPPWDLAAQSPDVAVLVVLKEEFRELRRALSERWHARENSKYGGFDYFWIDAVGGYRCVATFAGRMSPEEAVQYTNRLLEWQPRTIVNIGIAAALHSDIRIGDVVVPDLVVAYDKTSKAAPKRTGKWKIEPRSDAFRPSHALVEKIKHFDMAKAETFSRWQERGADEFEAIRQRNHEVVAPLLARGKEQVLREQPEVSVETLASGHMVVAAPAFAAWVRSTNGDLKALEMEAAGMLLAVEKRVEQFDRLVIRGISDHSALAKDESEAIEAGALRGLAMRNAWRLFESLLELGWLRRSTGGGAEEKVGGAGEASRPGVLFEGPGGSEAQAVRHFTGRDDELAQLEQLLLDNRTVCVVVSGIGGIGKTTLTEAFVATRAQRLFPAGVAWLDGEKLISELGRVSRRFGWSDEREPMPNEALDVLASALHDQRFLIVVDNFDPERGNLEHVPRPKGACRTLVTSRSRTLDVSLDAASLSLRVWAPLACRTYLRERCEHLGAVVDAELDPLAHFVGYLPLGIRLLVFLLRHRPGTPVRALLEMLKAKPLGVLDQHEQDRGIAVTFQASYDQLSDEGKRVLRALAVCAKQTRVEVVGAVAGVDDVLAQLDHLYTHGFAELSHGVDAPWGLHDVVRMFVLEQPGRESFEAGHEAWVCRHLTEHADPTAHREFSGGVDEARVLFERLVIRDLAKAELVYWLLVEHLRMVGRYPEAIAVNDTLLAAVPVDSALASHAMTNLGICHGTLGDIPKAIELQERSLAIKDKLGDLRGEGASLGNLGLCYQMLGEIPKAIELLERALAIEEKLGSLGGQATQLGNLGMCHAKLDDFPKAIELHERALAIEEKLGRLQGQAIQLGNLGGCYRELGDISKAIELHVRALAMDEQLGSLEGRARHIANLGVCYQTSGNLMKAIELQAHSLAIYEGLGSLEGQASNLGNMGLCYEMLGDSPKACDHYSRSIACFRRMGLPEEHAALRKFTQALTRLS
jgi:tetratricopeptide (TPR) repeat protein/nucleoside phosphorylase